MERWVETRFGVLAWWVKGVVPFVAIVMVALLQVGCGQAPVTAGDFSLQPASSSVSIAQGGQASVAIAVVPQGGFDASVALTAQAPVGVTAHFDPQLVDSGASSTVTITVAGTVTPGSHGVTVRGTADALVRTASVALTVTQGTQPPVGGATIAYVRPNDAGGDEIRLIEPNGSGDRLVWSTGKPDPYGMESIFSLAWRPDGGELAFASDHEAACSILESDLYGIQPDGGGHRRITNAPACAELADHPTGTVMVEVQNRTTFWGPFFVYVQGAPSVRFLSATSDTVLVDEVADLGEGVLQSFIVTDGTYRWWGPPVDVRAGTTVDAPRLVLSSDAFAEFGAQWPSWHASGSKLGFVLGLGTMRQIDAQPGPLSIGDSVLVGVETTGAFNDHLVWGPTPAVADRFLYATYGSTDSALDGIYLATAGGADAGERLVPAAGLVQGLAWLPDGSGFVYSVSEAYDSYANIHAYTFADGQVSRLTDLGDEFARQLTVSPDGRQIVFERATHLYFPTTPPSLWIVNRDGTDLRLLVENGRAPAWSR
jgi:hypothetical protein